LRHNPHHLEPNQASSFYTTVYLAPHTGPPWITSCMHNTMDHFRHPFANSSSILRSSLNHILKHVENTLKSTMHPWKQIMHNHAACTTLHPSLEPLLAPSLLNLPLHPLEQYHAPPGTTFFTHLEHFLHWAIL
jgi:hypothetical protein